MVQILIIVTVLFWVLFILYKYFEKNAKLQHYLSIKNQKIHTISQSSSSSNWSIPKSDTLLNLGSVKCLLNHKKLHGKTLKFIKIFIWFVATYITCEPLILLHESFIILIDLQNLADAICSHFSLKIIILVNLDEQYGDGTGILSAYR